MSLAKQKFNTMQEMRMLYETKDNLEASILPSREMVIMRREEAVALMTKVITDMNEAKGIEMGVPMEQIQEMTKMSIPEFDRVNAIIYDTLVEYGVIH